MSEPTAPTNAVEPKPGRSPLRAALAFLGGAVVFGLACSQAPLYYSNQNQYFLHGLADAGVGYLCDDWLAGTADPTPLFSALVEWTQRLLDQSLFYVYFLLLFGLYFRVLLDLATSLYPALAAPRPWLCFVALFVALHSGLVRLLSVRLWGVDYPWYFQAGVAGQYVLGAVFQPSVFGVLLLASIHAFLRDRLLLAAGCAALGALVHPTYLLSAAWLTLAYLFLLVRQGRLRDAVTVGGFTLVLVLPGVLYNLRTFAPTSPETFAEAQRLLVTLRIPHHAIVARWCDGIALTQVAGVVVALLLVRGMQLFWILAIPFVLSVLLTLVQVLTGSDTLALLFPWRTSVLLVPLATTILLARGVNALAPWLQRLSTASGRAVMAASGLLVAVCVAGGLVIQAQRLGYRMDQGEVPLMEFVRDRKAEGETYLLPVDLPRLGAGPRGAASTSFTPPPRRQKDVHLIAVDLQGFRLMTGAPILVDFKSIPYRDVDVVEWHRRLQRGLALYARNDWDAPEVRAELAQYGITHIITTADRVLRAAGLRQVYADERYRIYRVVESGETAGAGG